MSILWQNMKVLIADILSIYVFWIKGSFKKKRKKMGGTCLTFLGVIFLKKDKLTSPQNSYKPSLKASKENHTSNAVSEIFRYRHRETHIDRQITCYFYIQGTCILLYIRREQEGLERSLNIPKTLFWKWNSLKPSQHVCEAWIK